MVILVLLMVATALFLFRGEIVRQAREADQAEAVGHLRAVGLALFEFEKEYGSLPGPDTIARVREKTGEEWELGTRTSNDYFRQLLATDIADSEVIFYNTSCTVPKVDNVYMAGYALEKGECGFAYIPGGSSRDDPARPLACAPMISGTGRFDREVFNGMALILPASGVPVVMPIDRKGHVILDGKNLMAPDHPVWKGKPPVIAWPDI